MEYELIEKLRRSSPPRGLILGIGDDTAVLPPTPLPTLWTTDLLTEGIDFLLEKTDPRRIGRKALAVNLSDIAAMGGEPTAYLVALALPRNKINEPGPVVPTPSPTSLTLAEQLYEGMIPLAEKYGVVLAGGDTNTWDGGLVISITVLGRSSTHGIMKRSGGKPGDVVMSTGPFGGSILKHQFDFEPRIGESLYLHGNYEVHAAIDVSDGLSLDLFRLATASNVGATLWEKEIPITDDAVTLSKQSGWTPLEHALSDGEDFELIFTVPPDEATHLKDTQPLYDKFGVKMYAIGELTPEPGLRIDSGDGIRPLTPKGYEHK